MLTLGSPAQLTRLAAIYFFYFALVGIFIPYWPLYLESLGFQPFVIGNLMALLHITKIIAPSIWSWIADHKLNRVQVVKFGALLSLVSINLLFISKTLTMITCMMFCFSFFWNAILPQVEAITLGELGKAAKRYSRIRMWGSVGFILATIGGGILLEALDISILPLVCLVGAFCLCVFSWVLRPAESAAVTTSIKNLRFRSYLKRKEVLCFIVVCFFMQLSFGPYYSFMSILMQDVGYSKMQISFIWSCGVLAEIFIFIQMPRLMKRFDLNTLISIALVVAAVRWFLTPWVVNHVLILLVLQLTHAITFALFHSCCIAWVHKLFPDRLWGQGMALYSSVSYGLGGAIGSIVAGLLWDSQRAYITFGLAGLSACFGLLCFMIFKALAVRGLNVAA